MIELIRIDDSGIFALPDGVSGEVKAVFADGVAVDFTVTENGNIDVTEYDGKYTITAEIE